MTVFGYESQTCVSSQSYSKQKKNIFTREIYYCHQKVRNNTTVWFKMGFINRFYKQKQKKNPCFASIIFNSFKIIILYRRTFDTVVYMAPRNLKSSIKTNSILNSKRVIESYQYLSASMLILKVMFQLCCLRFSLVWFIRVYPQGLRKGTLSN